MGYVVTRPVYANRLRLGRAKNWLEAQELIGQRLGGTWKASLSYRLFGRKRVAVYVGKRVS